MTRVRKWIVWKAIIPLGTLVTVVATVYFSASTLAVSNKQNEVTRQTAISERYSTAIEQLGSEVETIRIGGIYSLESIALESPDRALSVFNVLFAFIRSHSTKWVEPENRTQQSCPTPTVPSEEEREIYYEKFGNYVVKYDAPPDLQAAVDIFARSTTRLENGPDLKFDLTQACLARVNFSNANLRGVILSQATLAEADFTNADLTGAKFDGASPGNASTVSGRWVLGPAKFNGAKMDNIDFTEAARESTGFSNFNVLRLFNLDGASFFESKFDGVSFGYTESDVASVMPGIGVPHWKVFEGADLRGASLRDVNLAGSDLSLVKNLDEADLTGAYYTASTVWPGGFVPPPSADCYKASESSCIVFEE